MNDEKQGGGKPRDYGFETRMVHAGTQPEPVTGARQTPIFQNTSYVFHDADHAASLFNLQSFGFIYSRLTNPTVAALEERLASLEGGRGATCTASGHAAQILAFFALMEPGDRFIAPTLLYGGSITQFGKTFKKFDWHVRFVDVDDLEAVERAITPKCKAIFVESLANPGGVVSDLEALSKVAKEAGVPLIVDNTFATPFLCRPFEWGADIVVHSATKFIGGHGTTIGGIIVDSGNFPWAGNPRFKQFNEPDPSYHGVVYAEALGEAAFIGRARVVPLRNMGAALSPFNAFLALQGLETLALRMDRHVENAQKVAEFLDGHEQIQWVNYAGLLDSRYHELAQRMTGGKPSAILSFGIEGGAKAGARFIDALQLIKRLVNIGDAKSLACHPASTTHRQLNPDELAAAGVSEDLVRLSIGIEHVADIIGDIEQALVAAKG
ncbi:MAG TPA: O-acetylhomoserine aminocarboxypropyltransferase [Porticoccaceae bacterium]|nr:O-acetylhomoserine aminocarboxypropyltransferase [Porticoccaceae bacterium]